MENSSSSCLVCKEYKFVVEQLEQIKEELHAFDGTRKNKTQRDLSNSSSLLIENVRRICETTGNLPEMQKNKKVRIDAEEEEEDSPHLMMMTPKEKATGIPLIIQQIVAYLPIKDRLNCRVINNLWNKMATLDIIKKQDWRIKFLHDGDPEVYQNKKGSLKEFVELLKNIKMGHKSPFVNFQFSNGFLDTVDVTDFFTAHGKLIQTLYLDLDYECDAETLRGIYNTLRGILFTVRSSLECLELRLPYDDMVDMTIVLFSDPSGSVQFPKLKKILVGFDSFIQNVPKGFWKDLLTATFNLETVEEFQIQWLEEFTISNKLSTIKIINPSSIFNAQGVESLYKLSNLNQVKLREINFEFVESCVSLSQEILSKLVNGINNILDSSRDNIKKIENFDDLRLLTGLKIPTMKMVNSVSFCFLPNLLPLGCPSLAQIFPNVVKVEMSKSPWRACQNNDWAIKNGQLSSVQQLALTDIANPISLQQFTRDFPNVTNLKIKNIDLNDLPSSIGVIWRGFQALEFVDVIVSWSLDLDDTSCAKMDSGITGMSVETCQQLFDHPRNLSIIEAQQLRILPSILDTKNLKSFKLHFDGRSDSKMISHVSVLYGFEPLRKTQGLKVYIKKMTRIFLWLCLILY